MHELGCQVKSCVVPLQCIHKPEHGYQLLTKGCCPSPAIPSSVLKILTVKLIPACVSRAFNLVVA